MAVYKTGADFLYDMVETYGVAEALRKAADYLLIPMDHLKPSDAKEEAKFRKELEIAMDSVWKGA